MVGGSRICNFARNCHPPLFDTPRVAYISQNDPRVRLAAWAEPKDDRFMSILSGRLQNLANIPIDELLPTAVNRLKHATLDELAAILSGRSTVVPSTDQLAEMILALPEKGSKLDAVQRVVVLHAVAVSAGNVSAAARLLGMERKSLERKLAKARRGR
jgi:hypothetical protein